MMMCLVSRLHFPVSYTHLAVDELENDEILNDIGGSKNLTGLERPEGEHPAYLKNSEQTGVAPEVALLIKSAFGGQTTASAELDTVAASTAGTATARAVIKVDTCLLYTSRCV